MQLNFILLAVVLASLVQFNTAQDNGEDKFENVTDKLEEKVLTTNFDEVENATTTPEETTDETKPSQTTADNNDIQTESEEKKDNLVEETTSKPTEGTTTTKTTVNTKRPTWCSGFKNRLNGVVNYVKRSAPTIASIFIVMGAIYAIVVYT